eukprot:10216303-Alexandrium_andersonii.AAC.1
MIRDLTKAIHSSLKQDKRSFVARQAVELEQAASSGNTRREFELVKQLMPYKPRAAQTMVRDGGCVNPGDHQGIVWLRHFGRKLDGQVCDTTEMAAVARQ